jgi:16S rRNA (adenine1518-N6/adenine1519-N6)-dimethyltransferase
VETAFGQRRKMLRRSLADRVPAAAFDAAGVEPTARPEQLDLAAWSRLTEAVAAPG